MELLFFYCNYFQKWFFLKIIILQNILQTLYSTVSQLSHRAFMFTIYSLNILSKLNKLNLSSEILYLLREYTLRFNYEIISIYQNVFVSYLFMQQLVRCVFCLKNQYRINLSKSGTVSLQSRYSIVCYKFLNFNLKTQNLEVSYCNKVQLLLKIVDSVLSCCNCALFKLMLHLVKIFIYTNLVCVC